MKDPSFPLYAQDFLTGVMYLTNEEIGIYIKMLSKQWTDGKIPKKRLGLLVGLEWEKLSNELKEKFIDMGEFVINKRLEDEREKRKNFKEKQSSNGKKGGRPRKISNSINPNETQKKPLENENENDIDNEIEVDFETIENAYDYLRKNDLQKIEVFEMQNKKSFPDYQTFITNFNSKVVEEGIDLEVKKLFARLNRLNVNWDKKPRKTKEEKLFHKNR